MSTLKVDNIRHNSATSDAITTASDGTCTARITSVGGGQLSNRNIIINGAMNVAQRATTYTGSDNYATVDRFYVHKGTVSENPTQAQVDVAAGTTPYSLGFRKAYKITNGNQTLAAGSFMRFRHGIEAQDLANCGWNYTSTSSKITLSFWIKSSVAQNFYVDLQTIDGTAQNFAYETGSLTANTWTKIVKTIPGNSNLTFDNDADQGMFINVNAYMGTNYSSSGHTLDTWGAFVSGSRIPDMSSTWYTTDDATFELTGVQLEVGDTATSFEFRSHGEEFARCQRYYQQYVNPCCTGVIPDNGSKAYSIGLQFQTRMRAAPTLTTVNAGDGQNISDGQNSVNISSLNAADRNVDGASIYLNLASDLGDFRPACLGRNDSTTHTTTYKFSAEL